MGRVEETLGAARPLPAEDVDLNLAIQNFLDCFQLPLNPPQFQLAIVAAVDFQDQAVFSRRTQLDMLNCSHMAAIQDFGEAQ